jgi:3-hydroxymyristoyl/3-hydroxydecanoyl-(acyl carrier protein) dehydratase
MMKWSPSEEVTELLDFASKQLLLPDLNLGSSPVMRRNEIEGILPHRDPFLFLDEILHFDPDEGMIAARYDLAKGNFILSGHFPGDPTWPGIFQVEAVSQAGGLLYNHIHKIEGEVGLLTNIIAARFMGKIAPGADLIVVARLLDFGQMGEFVGQTLQNGKICSVAATRCYSLSEEL